MTKDELPGEEHELLRFENEFLKAKILAEKDVIKMVFIPEKKLPLEIENQFLKCLSFLEDDADDIEEIPIYDFIGRPDFISEKDISDEKLTAELERLTDLLYSKKIIFSVLPSLSARQVYKFVTEDLFQHLILNIQDSDFGSHYFYEDFHPNHEYDSKRACDEFMDVFFSSDFHIRIRDFAMEDIRNFVDLIEFYDAFEEFRNVEYEFIDADVIPGECIRKASISFDAITSAGLKPIRYTGEATFVVGYIEECWTVVSAVFPGMTEGGES